ncbi:MAG: cation transporter dimerization domain-containing protein, partial [Pantoea sp.]|nr:cation transporter dimerization domain-containing protein [Pantoea sp.]
QQIVQIVTTWPGVQGAHDLRTRQSGPTRFIQVHLEIEDHLPLIQAHHVAEQVEQALLKQFPGSDIIIHQDPCSVARTEPQGFL